MTLPGYVAAFTLGGLWLTEAGLTWAIAGGSYWSEISGRHRSNRVQGLVSLALGVGGLFIAGLMTRELPWDMALLAGSSALSAWASVNAFRATTWSDRALLAALEDLPAPEARRAQRPPEGASSLHRVVAKLWHRSFDELEAGMSAPRRWETLKVWLRLLLGVCALSALGVSHFGASPWTRVEWTLAAGALTLGSIQVLLLRKVLRQLSQTAPRLEEKLIEAAREARSRRA